MTANLLALRIAYERSRVATIAAGSDPEVAAACIQRQAELATQVERARSSCPLGRLGLTLSEQRVFWFAVAHRMDPDLARLATEACSAFALGLTTAGIRTLIYGSLWEPSSLRELASDCPLHRLGLLEPLGRVQDELHQTWCVPPRILAWVQGDRAVWAPHASTSRPAKPCAIDQLAIAAEAVNAARLALLSRRPTIIVVSGAPGSGRRTLLEAIAAERSIEVLHVSATGLPKQLDELAHDLRQIARECRLLQLTPLISNLDALADVSDGRLEMLSRELAATIDTSLLATCAPDRPHVQWTKPMIAIEVPPPTSEQRARLWRGLLADATEDDAEYLATQYPLAPAMIHAASQAALARAAGHPTTATDIVAGIRAVLDDKLGNFARRVDVTQTWDDLVIDEAQAQAITELIARIRQRRTVYERWGFAAKVGKGLGVSALFSGPPGTGKTMVAALIAKELGLELYQVDTGKLVSKWIGETEKQLGAMFDAAEAGHAILLFDEADSLFGKRTEVRSSNDRYANLETNYLLQRLESFTGICLLTSNHESSIDPAFQRRLSLHLRFTVPDEAEREKLWHATLPAQAPIDANVDFADLARRYAMTGGYIKNATLRAAFLAADEGVAICETHLDYAARLEYEGMGKIASPVSIRPHRVASTL